MKLGENILKLRKQQGLSQEQLGEKVNVTRQTISNWELNETTPNPEQLKLLSKALNVSIDELLNNDIKSTLEEKVSNTQRLAGIIITILKAIGVLLLVFIIIGIIGVVSFISFRKETDSIVSESRELSCTIDTNKYTISISKDNFYSCDRCDEEMLDILGSLINTESMEKNVQKIEDYFLKNGGTCE